MNRIISKN